LVLAVIIH